MTMFEFLTGAFFLLILSMWAWERYQFHVRERTWSAERKELLNRLMARDWTSYMAIQQNEAEIEKSEHEEPVRKTSDYDRAWTA